MNKSTTLKRMLLLLGFLALPVTAFAQAAPPPVPTPTPAPPPNSPAPLGSRSTVVAPPPMADPAVGPAPKAKKPFLPVYRPFRLRIGALVPTQSRTRDEVDSSLFALGLSLDLGQTRGLHPAILTAYVDTAYGQNGSSAPVNRLVSVGIGLSARTYLSKSQRSPRPYIGLGLGAYSVSGKRDRLEAPSAVIGNVFASRLRYVASDTLRTEFGGKLFAGAEWNQRYFGEVSFVAAGSAADYSPTGATLSAGVRF